MLTSAPVAASIAVTDIDRARRFYGETLGLNTAGDDSGNAVIYEAGAGTKVLVYRRPNHQPSAATVAAFQVADAAKAVADLSARGVHFEDYDIPGVKTDENHIAEMPSGNKVAWFTDPDGNIIAVGEM